jgi:hypothetical protein
VAQALPSTSYIKMIEIWLLFHLIIPFFIFFILFWKEHKPSPRVNISNKIISTRFVDMDKDYLNKCATVILPIIIITFAITFFVACFVAYYT